ncbi:MAG TPA: hypothetical protein VER03_09075 [Bryobacteraceae bacterium]|nr:hypothetical protein [Bryobacteraceae bacterium]
MATSPTLPFLSVDEYLISSFRPDVQFVDGYLVGRSEPTYLHSLLQASPVPHFRQFEKAMQVQGVPELRTRIIACQRYRIPKARWHIVSKTGHRFRTTFATLDFPERAIPFDSAELFAALRQELADATGRD